MRANVKQDNAGAGGHLPHRRGVGPSTRSAGARFREERHQRDEQPAKYRKLVAMLRQEVGAAERSLVGFDEVCDWLNRMHVTNRYGGPVTQYAVADWRRRLGLPMLRGRRAFPGRGKASRVWTTNLAMTAWLLSLIHSGGVVFPYVRAR